MLLRHLQSLLNASKWFQGCTSHKQSVPCYNAETMQPLLNNFKYLASLFKDNKLALVQTGAVIPFESKRT